MAGTGESATMTLGLPVACPHCAAVFLLEEAYLNSEGRVGCGACGELFNAKWHLTEDPEGQSSGSAPEGMVTAVGTRAGAVFADSEVEENDPVDETDSGTTGSGFKGPDAIHAHENHARQPAESGGLPKTPKLPEASAVNARNDPQTSRAGGLSLNGVDHYIAPRSGPLNRLLWSVAALGLLAVLGWQVKYPFVEKYAQHRDYSPLLIAGCEFLNCGLPPRKDLLRLTLTHTRIDLHPLQPGAIRITVKLVNEAVFAQPWPDLQVTLTDWNGRVVGRRAFPPGRYLEEGQPDMLGSGELGVVLFDLARPHEKAVGFEVDIVARSASS